MATHDDPTHPGRPRHLDAVDPLDPRAGGADGSFLITSVDDFARRQHDLFRDLFPLVGGPDVLWALDNEPLPDEPFDWSSVAPADVPFVGEVLAAADECCDALLDVEYRTIARRLLARVAARDPKPFRRRPDARRCAAALVWLTLQTNWVFARRQFTAQHVFRWFGVGNCADRGRTLCAAAGFDPTAVRSLPYWGKALALGEPDLLHSRVRDLLVVCRDELIEHARERRTWFVTGLDGRTAHSHVHAEPAKACAAVKAWLPQQGRATVLVGFGDHWEDADYFSLSIPEAHDLVRKVQEALDMPLPLPSRTTS